MYRSVYMTFGALVMLGAFQVSIRFFMALGDGIGTAFKKGFGDVTVGQWTAFIIALYIILIRSIQSGGDY